MRASRSNNPASRSRNANWRAARIGPTVCELDGPMPTLKRSNALMAMARAYASGVAIPSGDLAGRRLRTLGELRHGGDEGFGLHRLREMRLEPRIERIRTILHARERGEGDGG